MRESVRAVRLRVARNVRELRKLRDLSQEQLAERVGNNQKHIGQIERGEVNVTIDVLSTLADELSVDISDLFRGDNREPRLYKILRSDFDQIEEIVQRVKRGGS